MGVRFCITRHLTSCVSLVTFQRNRFLSWAIRKDLVQTQNGQPTKVKKIDGHSCRCVFLKLDEELSVDKDGFMSLEYSQEELPFE